MISIKIDVKKIDKSKMFVGEKGTYLDLTLIDNKEGRDRFQNDGFIVQDIGKEARERGEKGAIIGNWKHVGKPTQSASKSIPFDNGVEDDEVPF